MTADLQPHLSNDRLYLRPLKPNDYTALFSVAADKEIWASHPAHDRWQEPVFRQFFDDAMESGGAMIVEEIMEDGETKVIIGSSRFDSSRCAPGEVEIGWTFLSRSHWGTGANAAMKRLMIDHALQYFDRVIFVVGAENMISRRAMGNIGGVLTDRTEIVTLAGEEKAHVVFMIDRNVFDSGPLGRTTD